MSRIFLVSLLALLLLGAAFLVLSPAPEAAAEIGANCPNALDDDGDTNVNDGCPIVGSLAENPSCVNAIDDDATDDPDDRVNDGCPDKGGAETACADAIDDDADTRVNDGCPVNGSNPENPACANAVDDDDSINDGCAQVGARKDCDTDATPDGDCTDPGEAALCENNTSDDGADDTVVNDGCPQLGSRLDCDTDPTPDGDCTDPGEAALCTNAVSDDPADDALGGYVNDGCPSKGPLNEGALVGGVARFADSGSSGLPYGAIAGGLAAAALALVAGAWYARRRLS